MKMYSDMLKKLDLPTPPKTAFRCGMCGETAHGPAKHANVMGYGLDLVPCRACGTLGYTGEACPFMVHVDSPPAHKLAEDSLKMGSMGNEDASKVEWYQAMRAAYFGSLFKQARLHAQGAKSVFDVGCNVGDFLDAVRRVDPEVVLGGCEVNTRGAELARERGLPVQGVVFQDAEVPAGLDVVSMLDVIEHTPTPGLDLARVFERLRPGGCLLIKTFYEEFHDTVVLDLTRAAYDSEFPAHGYFDPVSHLWHFSSAVLKACLERAGFQVVDTVFDRVWGQVTYYAVKP